MRPVDSYQKASSDIVEYLKQDPTILVINSKNFRSLLTLANVRPSVVINCYDHISIFSILPDLLEEIENAMPYPTQEDLSSTHFITELIASYGQIWIPVQSHDYILTELSFCDQLNMVTWQRYLRATKSNDERELTVLSIDPDLKVRKVAKKRLKTR